MIPVDESEIIEWGRVTFPDGEPFSLHLHMSEEMSELYDAICDIENVGTRLDANRDKHLDALKAEIGDLGIMLVHMAGMYDLTLAECINTKFTTARNRKYAFDPAVGYSKHVEEN